MSFKHQIFAFLMLFSFMGTILHDVIPHHHHVEASEANNEHETHAHEHHHTAIEPTTSAETCQNEHSKVSCEVDHVNQLDAHHECPHHFHNCQIQYFGTVYPLKIQVAKQLQVTDVQKGVKSIFALVQQNLCFAYPEYIETCHSMYLEAHQLRGPPYNL